MLDEKQGDLMQPDPFYKSATWHRLRAAVIRRSRGLCEAPGCTARGVIVDHIIARRAGGADAMHNLRHLCRTHDNQIKENARGERRSDGKLKPVPACDALGLPLDRNHPFYRGDASTPETPGGINHRALRGQESAGPRIRSKFDGR